MHPLDRHDALRPSTDQTNPENFPATHVEDTEPGETSPEDIGTAHEAGVIARDDMKHRPLFSIVLTTWNRPELLRRALQSLASQSFRDFEVIVINDRGEPVETILREFDLDITYACPGRNGGLSAARNLALRLCRGEIVGYLDDDDVMLPSHLAIHAEAHDRHPDSVVYTDTRYVLDQSNGVRINQDCTSVEAFSRERLFVKNFITVNNWTHPRYMLDAANGFDETLTALEDWDVLLRLASRHPFVHLPELTSEVWIHGGTEERMTARQQKNFPGLYRKLYERHGDLDSDVVRNGRRLTLEQLDAGAIDQVDDYPTLSARLRLDDQSEAFRSRLAALKALTSATVLVIDDHNDALAVEHTLDSLRQQYFEPVDIVVSSRVEACDGEPAGDACTDPLNQSILRSSGDWIVSLPAGDTLDRLALLLLAERFAGHTELQCCYVDEDHVASGTRAAPIFKPDINLDLLRSYPYVGSCLAIRKEVLAQSGGFRRDLDALSHVDLLFRIVEQYGLQAIGHIGEVLHHAATPYAQWLPSTAVAAESPRLVAEHLDRLGVAHSVEPGPVPGMNRVRYHRDRQPPISIIVPTRDQLPALNGLIDSLLATTSYRNYELLIVDNDSQDPATCAYLDGIERLNNPQLRVLRWPHPFNYPAINNFAAAQARGEYLLLLNDDTAVLHADWIEALLNHAQRPEVGIVGAKLHYPDGRIQHAGMVLGLHGPAGTPHVGEAMDAPGYLHRLLVDQNCSAVSAACLMIRKSVYEQVGGLDEQAFRDSCNDIDLCLKVREAGYLTVWTPHARLMHEGSASLNRADKLAPGARHEQLRSEQRAMYRKWLPLLARDPAYNRNLGLAGNGFDLDQIRPLAWQPFAQPLLPRMFCVAADAYGCGHYRIRQPFLAMQHEGLAEGMIAPIHLTPVPMERLEPTTIVLQRQLTDGQLTAMRNYRDFSRAFKVYELDDYLPNLPLKSVHRDGMPKDVLKSLRKAVALTDRFVVSTAPLAEQFADMHSDIRVVPNRLPVEWWSQLANQHRKGTKPRVGWAGGSSHRGDLELIADVVRELAGEVEWVFFGMCPEKLRPYVHELHNGVSIDQYPAALAALDLDLALAPLEDNLFNACKSNLRLLEYGACGFPVVCSDIVCYRGELPVTRVRNRFKEWVDAIRMHVSDLDASAKMGDALRAAVHRDWMLTGDNLVAWRDAWLPD